LHLLLDPHFLPGVELFENSEIAHSYFFTMDLPNLIEKFRLDYTSTTENCQVEVLWYGESLRQEFNDKTSFIQERGLEIIETEEYEELRKWEPLLAIHP
jgi:hypothetical protein